MSVSVDSYAPVRRRSRFILSWTYIWARGVRSTWVKPRSSTRMEIRRHLTCMDAASPRKRAPGSCNSSSVTTCRLFPLAMRSSFTESLRGLASRLRQPAQRLDVIRRGHREDLDSRRFPADFMPGFVRSAQEHTSYVRVIVFLGSPFNDFA